MKTTKQIPYDSGLEQMLIYAERYALGRRTYAVCDVCDYIQPLIPDMTYRALSVMAQDFEHCMDFGDNCDRRRWKELEAKVNAELDKRGATTK